MPVEGKLEKWLTWLIGPDSDKRWEAKLLLGALTPQDTVSLTPLVEALSSENDDLVFWSVIALASSGARAEPAVSELARVANFHSQFGNRQAVVGALSKVAPSNEVAKATVLRALEDTSPYVRENALQALIEFTELSAADLGKIRAMEDDSDEDVARWSEIAIRNIRLKSEADLP